MDVVRAALSILEDSLQDGATEILRSPLGQVLMFDSCRALRFTTTRLSWEVWMDTSSTPYIPHLAPTPSRYSLVQAPLGLLEDLPLSEPRSCQGLGVSGGGGEG